MFKFLGRFIGITALVWVAGFAIYLNQTRITADFPPEKVDAIVVLTGDKGRSREGVELLKAGVSKKMLISGVNRGVSKAGLLRRYRVDPDLLGCCIDLDYEAENTFENAQESAKWLRHKQVESIVLITSHYHMPRSLAEFKNVIPEITIYPQTVISAEFNEGNFSKLTQRILGEYNKYLYVLGRIVLQKITS
ncbi:MAG: YdcF family protein [Alphaproteobacteria bacterium]